jgi:four helix bundle protein
MQRINSYRDLIVWQKSILLTKEIYSVCSFFPEDERYGIVSQMKRAALSIPSNIAEGYGRNTKKDFQRFLSIALGSAYELQTQLFIAQALGFLNNEKHFNDPHSLSEEVIKMLSRLRSKLSL